MWHWTDKNTGETISGDRQFIKEQLNIFMVGFTEDGQYYEEIADVNLNYHWKQICEDYGIWGED